MENAEGTSPKVINTEHIPSVSDGSAGINTKPSITTIINGEQDSSHKGILDGSLERGDKEPRGQQTLKLEDSQKPMTQLPQGRQCWQDKMQKVS